MSEHDLRAAELAAAAGDYGTVLRIFRKARKLTQQQLGDLAGYSFSQVSRYETGSSQMSVDMLHRLAQILQVPGRLVGLSGQDSGTVRAVARRQVLAGAAGIAAGLALVPVPALAEQKLTSGIDDLLFGLPRPPLEPVGVAELAARVAAAQHDLDGCRYQEVARAVPDLIRVAVATRDATPLERRGPVNVLLSDSYVLATDLLTKFHEDGSAWAMADRAIQAAASAGHPRALAQARRRAAIVLRRSAHAATAQTMMVDTARDFAASTGLAGDGDAAMYAHLLCTASYTAALGGNAASAYELVDEARAAVAEHGGAGFGANDINLYMIGIARAAGDFGLSVQHTRLVRLDQLTSPERQARYWEDAARAWWGRERPDLAYRAMLHAEQVAPQEVRYRPWAQTLTTELLQVGPRVGLSGLREFAGRIGVS